MIIRVDCQDAVIGRGVRYLADGRAKTGGGGVGRDREQGGWWRRKAGGGGGESEGREEVVGKVGKNSKTRKVGEKWGLEGKRKQKRRGGRLWRRTGMRRRRSRGVGGGGVKEEKNYGWKNRKI